MIKDKPAQGAMIDICGIKSEISITVKNGVAKPKPKPKE